MPPLLAARLAASGELNLQPCWVIPPEQNANFVAHMEEVLDLYQQPYDPAYKSRPGCEDRRLPEQPDLQAASR